MSKLTLFDPAGCPSQHETVGQAIAAAKAHIYADEKIWKRAEERLLSGDPVTVTYGFASIQIWPLH